MLRKAPSQRLLHGQRQGGFSLIELLIVVAIILIIAAIAIPSLIRARISANEAAAVENCRTITSAEVIYYTTYGIGFSGSLSNLQSPTSGSPTSSAADLIDSVLASGTKSGYTVTYAANTPDPSGYFQNYKLNADPVVSNVTGIRHFFTDEPAVIRWNLTAIASATDPPL